MRFYTRTYNGCMGVVKHLRGAEYYAFLLQSCLLQPYLFYTLVCIVALFPKGDKMNWGKANKLEGERNQEDGGNLRFGSTAEYFYCAGVHNSLEFINIENRATESACVKLSCISCVKQQRKIGFYKVDIHVLLSFKFFDGKFIHV